MPDILTTVIAWMKTLTSGTRGNAIMFRLSHLPPHLLYKKKKSEALPASLKLWLIFMDTCLSILTFKIAPCTNWSLLSPELWQISIYSCSWSLTSHTVSSRCCLIHYIAQLLSVYISSRHLRSSSDTRTLRIPFVKTKSFGQRAFSFTGRTQ